MKIFVVAAAAVSVLAFPVLANAASLGLSVGLNAGVTTNVLGSSLGAGVSGQGSTAGAADIAANRDSAGTARASGNLDTLLTVLVSTKAEIAAVADVGEHTKVDVLQIGAIASANADVVQQAAIKNEGSIAQLRAAIVANAELNSELEAAHVGVENIIAADVAADGTLVLYSNS